MQKLLKYVAIGIIGAVVSYAPMIATHRSCAWSIAGVELFVGIPIAAFFAAIFALPFLLWSKARPIAVPALIICSVLCILFVPALDLANRGRRQCFLDAAERSRPLISAIEAHVRDTGTPPESLGRLVPNYLKALPDGLPPFEIVTGPDALKLYGNEWALRAAVPTGIINFDSFLYFPNQQYPEQGYGGWLERIERWAYVHE